MIQEMLVIWPLVPLTFLKPAWTSGISWFTCCWSLAWRIFMSNFLPPHGLYNPWNSPGQNTRVGSLFLFQGIFTTQGLNPGLPHYRQILYQLSHKGSPRILEWVAYPFSSGSSRPRNQTGVSCIAGRFFTNWTMREAYLDIRKSINVFLFLIYLLFYFIVLVLPYIDLNLPWVYMCSPSWTLLPDPPHPIPLGHPSAPAPSILYHASNLDWRFISHMIIYMFFLIMKIIIKLGYISFLLFMNSTVTTTCGWQW